MTEREMPEEEDGGMYGVFGEGKPRNIVGESDQPPRRRPRKRPEETAPRPLDSRDR